MQTKLNNNDFQRINVSELKEELDQKLSSGQTEVPMCLNSLLFLHNFFLQFKQICQGVKAYSECNLRDEQVSEATFIKMVRMHVFGVNHAPYDAYTKERDKRKCQQLINHLLHQKQ